MAVIGSLPALQAQQPGATSREKGSGVEATAQTGGPKGGPKVTLGDSDGSPGETVVVPIYFTPAEGVEVGKATVTATFVSKNLKYSSLKRGLAGESGNVDIYAELEEGKNEKGLETSTLTIDASMPQGQPDKKGLPAGLLGYITFNVSQSAGPANITLRTAGQAVELETNRPVQNFQTVDAQVDILAAGSEPLYSCFFFSH